MQINPNRLNSRKLLEKKRYTSAFTLMEQWEEKKSSIKGVKEKLASF